MGFVLGSIFFLLLMGTAGTLPRLFTSDPLVAATIAATFPIMAVIQPVNGLVFTLDGIFTAGRKFTFLSVAIFVAASISSAVLLFVRNTQLPLTAVWCGLNVMVGSFLGQIIIILTQHRWYSEQASCLLDITVAGHLYCPSALCVQSNQYNKNLRHLVYST